MWVTKCGTIVLVGPNPDPAYPREASLRGLAGLNVRIAGLGGLPERIAFSACASVLPSAIDALRGLRSRSFSR